MKKYALIGKSLSHSFSQDFFTNHFAKNEIDATYQNIEIGEISEFVNVKNQFDGFNVTIPYKVEIIPFLDELDEVARAIGAVNVIKKRNSQFIGYNTDAYGFQQSIKPFLTNRHERAMIIGTGGVSKAIAHVLENLGIDVLYVSRNPFGEGQYNYSDVNSNMIGACKLIVNCTPIGTFPDTDNSPLSDLTGVSQEHLVVDLIYNPAKTRFLQQAEMLGASIMNGKSMLELQALKSYEIWTNE